VTRVLIVEAGETEAEHLQIALQEAGFTADIALDAEQALERLANPSVDLVISDILIPGSSGFELCAKIKADPALRRLPVVLLTTRRDPTDLLHGLECGADGFYTKPFDAARLIERLRNILQTRELRTQGGHRTGMVFSLFGQRLATDSTREQLLDLLISTFEDEVLANRDLERMRDELAEVRDQLELRARTSEERCLTIFEGISDGVLSFRGRGAIDTINPAALRLLDLRLDDALQKSLSELLAPASRQQLEQALARLDRRSGKVPVGIDGEIQRGDGALAPVEISLTRMPSDASAYIAVIRDLSFVRAAEAQLQEAQRMESMGQLTGGLAHDFNNLLTVIMGNSEALCERLQDHPDLLRLADMVLGAAQRGADLTQRLLAFARRQALDPRPVDINALVQDMQQLLVRTLGGDTHVRFCLGSGLPTVMIDPGQLENALLNLCINARDAMPDGGRLDIETSVVELGDEYTEHQPGLEPGTYTLLAVSDTGCGIPPDVLQHVFEPFFTTKEPGRGTGLGLPMVYGFIKQSSGHISIYSEIGEGTTVKLYLPPAVPGPSTTVAPADDSAILGGTETILLVEDDELVRAFAEAQLRSLGYDVTSAASGPEALALLQEGKPFDLLFTDVVMPGGMSGRQLATAAQALRPELPVLYTSGYSRDAIMHQGRLDAGVQLLSKPYRRRELAQRIRQLLDRSNGAAGGH